MVHTDPVVLVPTAVFGLLVGSFLNVLIYRMPREKSVVFGRSSCPHCDATVRWFDNIPVVSYLTLRGRCRHCRTRISAVYPIVELLTALAAVVTVGYYGPSLKAAWIFAFVSILLVITLVDWQHQIIPDELSIGGIVLGWIGALVCLDMTFVDSLLGSLVGGGVVLVIALLYKAVRKVDGMGGGDVKLMGMIGAFVGWKLVFPVLFFASLFGSVYGVYLMARGRTSGKTAVAFGSFLAPSATLVFVFGAHLIDLYLGR